MMSKEKYSGNRETEYPGQVHFHYNREERQKHLSQSVLERDRKKRGLFRKNKTLLIIFLDVMFILILYFIVVPIINKYARKTDFMGYEIQLKAFMFEDQTYFSLKIEAEAKNRNNRNGDAAAPEESSGEIREEDLVTVRFTIEGSEESQEITDILPEGPGESRIIRGTLAGGGKKKKAFADIEIRGSSKSLKTEIVPEQD